MFETLIDLLESALPGDVVARTLAVLARDVAGPYVVQEVGRALLKGVDDVVVAAVKTVPADKATVVATEYAKLLADNLGHLEQAVNDYIPHQVAVEAAKKQFGNDSAEANAARADREKYITEVRTEVKDVFGVLLSTPPA